jgi:uncharacterized membrane protein
MESYPAVVAQIANDYSARVKARLQQVPAREREEFLREIESHIYEAYQRESGEDPVCRILSVLRKLGEPQDLVADRLPEAIVRSGTARRQPMHLIAGVLIALFGLPLGFGGVGALIGVLASLLGLLVAYYATAGAMLVAGAMCLSLGALRIYQPAIWDRLVAAGVIHFDDQALDFLESFPTPIEGFLFIATAVLLIGAGLGMLWLGRYLVRGMRFLFAMIFDWARRAAESVRRWLSEPRQGRPAPLGDTAGLRA